MKGNLNEELKLLAVEIADDCMRDTVETYGVGIEGKPRHYSLADEMGHEVQTLEQAAAMLREAHDYLKARGLAVLTTDEHGTVIQLIDPE